MITMNNTSISMMKLYDREEQQQLLFHAYERCCFPTSASQREVIVVTGPQGAGKTALAYQVKDRVEENGGYFCMGKFRQLDHLYRSLNKSYDPIISALSDFCKQIGAAGEDQAKLVKSLLQESFSDNELRVLDRTIPDVGVQILGRPATTSSSSPTTSGNSGSSSGALKSDEDRVATLLCRFFNVVAKQILLVFFLDDIQWADNNAMELITKIAGTETRSDGSTLMLLCSCRTHNEDDASSPMDSTTMILREISDRGIAVTSIPIQTVSEHAVSQIILEYVRQPIDDCESMARWVHDKSEGNIFFVLQLLRWWQDDRITIAKGNLGQGSEEEEDDDDDMFLAFDLSQLLENRIGQLANKVKDVLKVAACLGPIFEEKILWAAGTVDKVKVASALQVAAEKGLIISCDVSGTHSFAHDKIRRAAYTLIPEAERASFCLDLGRRLFPCLPPSVVDEHILLIADLIAPGSHLVDDPEEKAAFAELYLRAGQRAALLRAIPSAAALLNVGINLLGEDKWTSDQYSLTLTLYNMATELEFYTGNVQGVDELVAEVVSNARTFEATLKSQFTRIYSLGTRGKIQAAVDEGLIILKKLGDSFPSRITSIHTQSALTRCRRILHEKSVEDIVNLPVMTDANKLTSLRLMLVVACYAASVRKKLVPLIAVRAISNTIAFGMNDTCCAAFATLSWTLACRGLFDEAARAGDLALQLLDRNPDKEWRARVSGFVYGGVYCLRHPYKESLPPLLSAHRSAIVLGDIHFSMACALFYSGVAFYSGVSIPKLAQVTSGFRDLCLRYKLKTPNACVCATLQVMNHLIGKSNSQLNCWSDHSRSHDGQNESAVQSSNSLQAEHPFAYLLSLYYKHFLAVYLDDLPEAQSLSSLIQSNRQGEANPFSIPTYIFLDGIVAAKSANASNASQKLANNRLVQLRQYAQGCPKNFQNKVLLLEAELLVVTQNSKNLPAAFEKYKNSADLAAQNGLIHEQGLAWEHAAYAFHSCGRLDEAHSCLEKARSCYRQWGAHAKVALLAGLVLT